MPGSTVSGNWVSRLRHFVSPPSALEYCQFCQVPIAARHPHLIELSSRGVVCACPDCADSPDRPPRLALSPDPAEFAAAARLCHQRRAVGRVSDPDRPGVCVSRQRGAAPGGALSGCCRRHPIRARPRSLVGTGGGQPGANELAPDVEALLVNRTKESREYYRAPIDRCFALAGLIRTHWRGLSGGSAVWDKIEQYFARLRSEAAGAERDSRQHG